MNNGCGEEFHNYQHRAYKVLNGDHEKLNQFVAAGGHTGTKKNLVRHFAEDIGFEYLTASNKDEFNKNLDHFLASDNDRSIIFEVFTDVVEESKALKTVRNLKSDSKGLLKGTIKTIMGK